MLKRLRIKLIAILMVVMTMMLLVILGLLLRSTQQNLEQSSLQMMKNVAMEFGPRGKPDDIPRDVRLPFFTIQLGAQDEILSAEGGYYDLSDEEFLREITAFVLSSGLQTGTIDAYKLRFSLSTSPMGTRIVFADISSELATMSNLWKLCVLVGILGIGVFLLMSILLARWAVKPVARAWEQQNQFVEDASHELKTPLTVILTNAELLQLSGCNEEARAQSVGSILTMAQQMRSLVAGLLELARADNGAAKTSMTQLDFSELVSDTLLPFEPVYYEKGLSLRSEIKSGITLTGSDMHLRQVLEILLDNALKYAHSHTEVAVLLDQRGQHCLLSVANRGEPIPPAELKSIFNRFYRIDKARGNAESYGLGLAIAESIVKEHGGRIWAESHGEVNTFLVQLPM